MPHHRSTRTVFAVLMMGLDLCRQAADVNDYLRDNRRHIDRLRAIAPDLWEQLRDATQARRAALSAPPPAAPPAPLRTINQPKPPPRPVQGRLKL